MPKSRFKRGWSFNKNSGSINHWLKEVSLINLASHGYYGFKLYFLEDKGLDVTKILHRVNVFERYIKRNLQQFSLSEIQKNKVFVIDFDVFSTNEEFLSKWTDFKNEIVNSTEYCLQCMGLAMHQTIIVTQINNENGEQLPSIPVINARIINYKPIINLKKLKAGSYGNLISIRGTVVKVGCIKLLCKWMDFVCTSCNQAQIVNQTDGVYTLPTKCPTQGCATKSGFIPLLGDNTCTTNWQTIKLQGLGGLNEEESGRVPRTIECVLTEDLVGCCIPGDDIVITGVTKVCNVNDFRVRKSQSSIFSICIKVISVINNKNQCQGVNSSLERITFNTSDYHAIQNIHSEPDVFRFLVHSLCPNIYGNNIIKAGLLLTLFGSATGSKSEAFSRMMSHILIVGDPGLGKSRLLQACCNVAPRGVYICGNTSTGTGLTVTLTKDSQSDYSLEAGALVLADQGCCCIDEFDKMTVQHAALLEAMEQQRISIAKAGVSCSLSAATSVIAAANPAGGHYNKAKTVSENIKISCALISRFDLVFILLDQPCKQQDFLLSEHILELHCGLKKEPEAVLEENVKCTLLEERLELKSNELIDHLPVQLMRKYIAYAQKYVHPKLSKEACEILKNFYLELRKQCQINNQSTVTARQLESLLRLTRARARAELREEATAADAIDVIEITRHSFLNVFTDERGELDLNRSQSGSSLGKHKQIKNLLLMLQNKAESLKRSTFSQLELQTMAREVDIPDGSFLDIVQKLNFHGYLLKRAANKFQLTSVDYI